MRIVRCQSSELIIEDCSGRRVDGGVVDQNIDRAECCDNVVDRSAISRIIGDIELVSLGSSARRRDLRRHRFQRFRIEFEERDLGTLSRHLE